ncbi:MAG TPA: cation transporter [Crenotrichaceae bacterium]|nr:cation transporter [Crenotrichaceae bacterium]
MSAIRQQAKEKRKATLIAALVNLVLAIGKTTCGIFAHSEALVADGIHSLSDLLTDIITVIAIKIAAKEADSDHPYGHARFETLATVTLGMILMTAGAGILVSAVDRLQHPEFLIVPGLLAVVMTVLSIVANEWLYHYTTSIAKRTRSQLMKANAWHHRSDSISSIIVLAGLIAAIAGFGYADAIAASIVAVMVAKIGYELIVSSILELVDTALPKKLVDELRNVILDTDGVAGLHRLRTRRMGPTALADVHIMVSPRITVSEGHLIADNVRNRLRDEVEELSEVLVHVDPEDDDVVELSGHCQSLPQRSTIIDLIDNQIRQLVWPEQIKDINLHYLQGHVEVELILSRSEMLKDQQQQRQAEDKLCSAIKQIKYVSKTNIYYQ